ncbi:hypothetical protein [Actinomadura sp. B10D3]|uniref:hypothetical protein n=1 Tax=Actinomadura sp. B10D3 TaxID=3153557 RepID=UPI00325CB1E1
MNELPYLGALAMRHAWAEREYARLHADIVEARLTARARATEKAAERRARLRARFGGLPLPRRDRPAPHCARAAARSAGAVGLTGGAR